MLKIAFVFPGQGSQSIGMGKDLYDNFKTARVIFEEACDLTNFDLKKLCFDGTQADLDDTFNTQPALLTVSMAAYKIIIEETGLRADCMAGHSLGEYSALAASGSISFVDAVKLVRFRGKVMSEAGIESPGAMAAIIGLERELVNEAIFEAKGELILTAANYNCPGQIVISGHAKAVLRAMELCKQKGAKRALPLAVSGPFHSELMSPAAEKMRTQLAEVIIDEPICDVYSNVTAHPYASISEIAPLLVEQMRSSVLWEDTVNEMVASGTDIFIEVGAGKVLSGLIKRISKEVVCDNVSDTETLKKTIAAFRV